jgi:hypothetical protein
MNKIKFSAKPFKLGGSIVVTVPKVIYYNMDPEKEYEFEIDLDEATKK